MIKINILYTYYIILYYIGRSYGRKIPTEGEKKNKQVQV